MDFFLTTNNFFSVQIIVNISISVFIGIVGANLSSDLLRWATSHLFPVVGNLVLHRIQPVTLQIGVTDDLKSQYGHNVKIPFYSGRSPLKLYILITPKINKLPFLYKNYQPNVIVNLLGLSDNFSIQEQKISDGIWRLGEYLLDIDRPQQIQLRLTPRDDWSRIKNEKIAISVSYDKKMVTQEILLIRKS